MMTLEAKVRLLATMTNRDEAGRHFTERYADDELTELEEAGLIAIDKPIHSATGIPYSQDHWHLEVTEEGVDLVQANPGYHPAS